MEELYRVLNKNGIGGITVPDLEAITTDYMRNLELALEGNLEVKHDYEWIKLELLDQTGRNESGGDMKNIYISQ